jgi:hypothetical protein
MNITSLEVRRTESGLPYVELDHGAVIVFVDDEDDSTVGMLESRRDSFDGLGSGPYPLTMGGYRLFGTRRANLGWVERLVASTDS